MRIAMIGQKGMPATYGGVERHVHDLAVRLVQADHEVSVYSRAWYTGGKNPMVEGVYQQYTPSIHTKHLDTITHVLTATIHAIFQDYDIIHYHGIGPSLLAWIPRVFAPKTKVVVTFHSLDRFHQKWGWFARTMLGLAEKTACAFGHHTITVSKSLQQYCDTEHRAATTYIPNGVPTEEAPSDQSALQQFGLADEPYIVMVSRLIPHKGAHLLIEAFNILKQENKHDPRVAALKLAIVGGSSSTDAYVETLHTIAQSNPDIIFTDFQSGESLKQLMGHAEALIHPSMNEGLPITVLEAMAIGKPTLLSTIPEHVELETNPRFLFPEQNVQAILTCLKLFLTLTKKEKLALGQQNRTRVLAEYSWDVVVPRIQTIYESVTSPSSISSCSSTITKQRIAS